LIQLILLVSLLVNDGHVVCVNSTIASLQSSFSELNAAYVQLQESVEEKQRKLADYEEQVKSLSSQLHGKVSKLIFYLLDYTCPCIL